MARLDLDCIYTAENGLLEGPRWDDKNQELVVADARNGGVLGIRSGHEPRVLIAHRRGIGGLALHAGGGCVVSGRNVAYKPYDYGSAAGATRVLIDRDEAAHRVGFNDLCVDQKGRVYVGSMAFVALDGNLDDPSLRAGQFWLIETDGQARCVAEDIRISNGTALSPDGRILYLSDSGRRNVLAFDVDPESGALSGRREFVRAEAGLPDGMAVAQDGSVWISLAFAGRVERFDSAGRLIERHSLKQPMITSLCFGGPDLKTLYVVTGVEHGIKSEQSVRHSESADHADHLAYVFAARVDVPGTPVHYARTPREA